MAVSFWSIVVAVAGAAIACSSVPDVQFVDGGESTSASSSSGTSGDASPEAQAPPPPPDWACPDKRPPEGSGSTCCGDVLCLKCSASDCAKCEQEGCPGTISAACCRKNPVQMECRAYSQCL